MNKRESKLLSSLYRYMERHEINNHHLFCSREVLKSIIRGEYSVAESLLELYGGEKL